MRLAGIFLLLLCGCFQEASHDLLILRGGTIYDADIAINGDSIATIGDLTDMRATREVNVEGPAVSPGFINMLSWATESLITDGRSLSDIRQGVTLEVFGDGISNGPLNEVMKEGSWGWVVADAGSEEATAELLGGTEIPWTTLDEYLSFLESKGGSQNVASLIGAATAREYVLGEENHTPTSEQLEQMQDLVREAMTDGALDVRSSMIYVPGTFASTQELTALTSAAGEFNSVYTSHVRSEGSRLLESIEDLIQIAQDTNVHEHVYHLKAAGKNNWHKTEAVIDRIQEARSEGLNTTADIYTYVAGATGLDASIPPDVREGEMMAWHAKIQAPLVLPEWKQNS